MASVIQQEGMAAMPLVGVGLVLLLVDAAQVLIADRQGHQREQPRKN